MEIIRSGRDLLKQIVSFNTNVLFSMNKTNTRGQYIPAKILTDTTHRHTWTFCTDRHHIQTLLTDTTNMPEHFVLTDTTYRYTWTFCTERFHIPQLGLCRHTDTTFRLSLAFYTGRHHIQTYLTVIYKQKSVYMHRLYVYIHVQWNVIKDFLRT